MYNELRPTLMAAAREALRATREKMPNASCQSVWNQCKKDNPKLFGKLQAADWEEDDKAEEREAEENEPQPNRFKGYHGEMQPQTMRVRTSVASSCKAVQNSDGSLTIQDAFFNRLC